MNIENNIEVQDIIKLIDKKVKFIEANRHVCEQQIRDLNNRIDIDFVSESEILESNAVPELENLHINEHSKLMLADPHLLKEMFPDKRAENALDEDLTSSLVIVNDDSYRVYPAPRHLYSLSYALRKAREDRRKIQSGLEPLPLTRELIEKLHEIMFEDSEFDKSRFIGTVFADGVPGYGSYRHEFEYYGQKFKPNVKITDDRWEASDCNDVENDMAELINNYNYSPLHPILSAIEFNINYIRIQPFRDGNKRSSRILFNYMMVRYGYPTITIEAKDRKNYTSAIVKAINDGDYLDIFKIISNAMNKRCDKYIKIINKNLETMDEQNINTFEN